MPKVNPEILKWARETAGLSLSEAAKSLQINDGRRQTGAERLASIEAGYPEPTRALLSRMAAKYKRPLITFYLASPPPAGDRGEDFRRASPKEAVEFNPQLDALIRNVRSRHDVVRSLLEDEEVKPLSFVGSRKITDGASIVATDICKTIGFDLNKFREAKDATAAFNYLRTRLEDARIFVMLLGNLGSWHSNIDPNAFRGYAIADPIAPFIIINDNDARAAWSFTALHEAAHLWLGTTGVSGSSHEAKIEKFCNDVAGYILLPPHEILQLPIGTENVASAIKFISQFASERNISRRMVAYALLRNHAIDASRYRDYIEHFRREWLRKKAKDPDDSKEGRGGPSRYVVLRHRLGPALLGLARRNLQGGNLSPTKASRLLGVNPGSVRTFLRPESVV